MPLYRCRIGTQDQRIVERDFRAADRGALTALLEARGQVLLEARRQFHFGESSPPDPDELALAFSQAAALLRGGVGLADALDAVGGASRDVGLRRSLAETSARLRAGTSIQLALDAEPDVFDPLLIAATRGAADSTALASVLSRRATALTETAELSRKVRAAAAYPALLLGASGIVLAFVIGHVVPSIGRLFEESGAAMPLPTRIAVSLGTVVAANASWLVPLLIVLGVVAGTGFRSERGARVLDWVMGRMPFIGSAWIAHPWTGWAFTVSEAVNAAVPLPDALRLGAASVARPGLGARLIDVAREVERGTSLATALRKPDLACPPLVGAALAVDVKGSELAALLAGAARAEAARITWTLTRLSRLVEPALVVGVGVVIGAIVVALYLPILSLVETL